MKNFIFPEELSQYTDRTRLYAGMEAAEKEKFLRCHLPGSFFLSLDTDLTGDATTGNGRHPLPEMNAFADQMMALGISADTPVFVYGEGLSMAAYRLWWMLRAVGVQDVKVLYDAESQWKEHAGDAVTPVPETPGEGLAFDPTSMVEMTEVRRRIETGDITLIDSRNAERYNGIEDELDHRPGHIPTAHSYPYLDLNKPAFPSKEEIERHYRDLPADKPVVAYCGSGVSAQFNMMLLEEIGIESTLYPGSFSGWIEDPDNPVVSEG